MLKWALAWNERFESERLSLQSSTWSSTPIRECRVSVESKETRSSRTTVPTSRVGLADGLADLVDEVVGELHGVGVRVAGVGGMGGQGGVPGVGGMGGVGGEGGRRVRRRRAGRQAPLALRQHLLQLLGQRRRRTYRHTTTSKHGPIPKCTPAASSHFNLPLHLPKIF